MGKVDVVNQIGDVLTQTDMILSDPGLSQSSPEWQQLFALRKHLDDQQRELVQEILVDNTNQFANLAAQLSASADSLEEVADDINKIGSVLQAIASVSSLVDKILSLAT
jgi:hypothetical protein